MWFSWRKIARRKPSVSAYLCSTTSSLKDILGDEEPATGATPQRSTPDVFRRSLSAGNALRFCNPLTTSPLSHPAADRNRIVLYHTSLRVVRRTFEDCRTVRSILSNFPVAIDERDLSIDSRFRAELQGIVGKRKKLTLPVVLIGGRYIYNSEEMQRLHETGELKKMVEAILPWVMGFGQCSGGVQFVHCRSCNVSHNCSEEKGGGFWSCPACNESKIAVRATTKKLELMDSFPYINNIS
ncbi:hypothetical protein KSP40_PGU007443 [Platanthera guangdongensis]|uniref:Glutaredoxin domain-containing protein n=1 Tax=Platanthera guangdongensis TaxID=2320717 RepID=A0ABR2M8V8_9ASPA